MMPQTFTRLLADEQGDICWVTINRPGDRNSIDSVLMAELEELLAVVEQTQTRAMVFIGAGDTYFVGGADGVEMMQCDPEGARNFSIRIQKLFNRMEASPLILVAAINGICFGGGFEFALACDLRLAIDTARIGLPEVKVGIIPGGGGTQRLPRLVGTGRALQMILSGKLYSGADALELGLVHQVVPADSLTSEVVKILAPIFRNPQQALSQAKRAVRAAQSGLFSEGLQAESEAFSQCFKHDYFKKLMCRQLAEGTLKTTLPLPGWICREEKEKE
ncbi:MAG: enoyl-CoA hydratase/isomerase family protein [Planctomycetales bacterium]|nr:enoyl-CoA hydratase/isomerase family protein [Planctomycetales bacterium]